ncbi:hypothetical protein HHI36_003937 [Cryptolaemus montrouzieri]|uniref:Immunoglobulin-binding protein 1 n=1 Tax=Cryptolaemus montrouzieri TaxID=559131 RepID=A0ABD2NRB7_9CUCU
MPRKMSSSTDFEKMTSNDVTNIENDVSLLPALFNQGLDLFNNLGRLDEPTNSLEVQYNVKKCIKIFERATILCSYASIFSNNEGVEEIDTADLQYFLLPALLGSLHLKLTSGERRNIVEVTEVYFTDFMKRCVDYGLCKYDFKKKSAAENEPVKKEMSEMEELTVLAKRRALKIGRFKEQQELKRRLGELKELMQKEHADEEIKRKYFLTMIELYIYEAVDELHSLELENLLLEHMSKLKKNELSKPRKRPSPPLQPVIITKDILQNKMCYTSYPLPTMPVKEFYNKRLGDDLFSKPDDMKDKFKNFFGTMLRDPHYNTDDICQSLEHDIDTDDYHIIEAMKQRGQCKDSHLRGCGNRMDAS